MRCIFCRNEKPERATGEHVVSFSLGGSWTIPDVCKECDNRFGTTHDANLARFTPVERQREELRLAGHSGAVPNRLREALSRPVPVIGGSGRKVLVSMDRSGTITGSKTIPLAKFVFSRAADGELMVGLPPENVAIDPTNVTERERILVRCLRDDAKDAGIPLSEEQVAYVAAHHARNFERVEENTTVEVSVPVRMGGHMLGLAKIAFEAAWAWLGDGWLEDPVADAMRRHLLGDEDVSVRVRHANHSLHTVDLDGMDSKQSHVVTLLQNGGSGTIYVQLFDVVSAEFVVTEQLRRYDPPNEHAVVLDAVAREHRFINSRTLFPSAVTAASSGLG